MANLGIIKTIATQKGIPLNELAERVGMTSQSLSKIMREGSTKIETLERIAGILGVSPSVFFEGSPIGYNTDSFETVNERENLIAFFKKQNQKQAEQIDKLLSIIQDLSSQTQKGDATSDATSADVG